MAVTERKQFISLPLKFVFTEEGASALIRQNVKINRLKMGDQTENYGVFLEKITPDFLQRMVLMNYISKIEVSGVEPVESRSDIIELSKLIVFSILYRTYAEVSREQLLASEPVKQWNHSNPSLVIDGKTQFKEGQLQSFIEQHPEELTEIQQDILNPIYKNIENDSSLQPDEKESRREILQGFLTASFPLSWFVLLKFYKSFEFQKLANSSRSCLVEYLKKSNIAEYSSLMLMELATNIENLNIQKEAKLLYGTSHVDTKRVVLDPNLRLPVIDSLRKKNSLLTFSWKLGGTSVAIGTRGRFQVVLYDQDIHYAVTSENVAQSKTADVRRFNLSEFYNKLNKSGNDLDLGMFYLSFLDEACKNMGIKFESMVNQSQLSGMGQTITTLTYSL
ncbi:MAG: hypothetical protein FWG27_03735 [Treponema sp.]|jgi:hypothetical protein|nr:hypothetical protein [Treponema sp.]